MKVVYLIDQALDERNYERFGIEIWQQRGWTIEAWDMTALAHPAVWQAFVDAGRPLRTFAGYLQIGSTAQLRQALSDPARIDCYVDFGGESAPATRAKLHLARRGARRILCAVASAPEEVTVGSTPGFWNKVQRAVRSGPARSWAWAAAVIRDRAVARLAKPGLIVAAGEESLRRFARWAGCDVVRAHNLDYDIYLRLRAEAPAVPAQFAVFLDQDLCYHPDYAYDKIPVYVTPDEYFPAMRRGLRRVAAEFGLDVRVAAHPRSSYERRAAGLFGEAVLTRGVSAALIRDCRVAIGHFSGVIQMAVLFDKPVIFFTTNQLRQSPLGSTVEKFAAELGKSVIDLEGNLDAVNWQQELVVDAEKYRAFRHRHIKMDGSPQRMHWDIVIDWLERATAKAL